MSFKTFTLLEIEAVLSARLESKPFRRSVRSVPNKTLRGETVTSIEVSYSTLPTETVKKAVTGLQELQPLRSYTSRFYSESGHWINLHPAAAFHLEMKRYDTPDVVRFVLTPARHPDKLV